MGQAISLSNPPTIEFVANNWGRQDIKYIRKLKISIFKYRGLANINFFENSVLRNGLDNWVFVPQSFIQKTVFWSVFGVLSIYPRYQKRSIPVISPAKKIIQELRPLWKKSTSEDISRFFQFLLYISDL